MYTENEHIMKFIGEKKNGVPVVAQWLTNPTRNHEVVGPTPSLGTSICRQSSPRNCKKDKQTKKCIEDN